MDIRGKAGEFPVIIPIGKATGKDMRKEALLPRRKLRNMSESF